MEGDAPNDVDKTIHKAKAVGKALSRGAGLSAYSFGKGYAFQSEFVEEMTKYLQEIGSQLKILQDGNRKRNNNSDSNQLVYQ